MRPMCAKQKLNMFDLEIVAHVKTSRKWFTLTVKFGRNSDECTSSAAFSQSATGSYKAIIINRDKRGWLESRKRTCFGYIARTGCERVWFP